MGLLIGSTTANFRARRRCCVVTEATPNSSVVNSGTSDGVLTSQTYVHQRRITADCSQLQVIFQAGRDNTAAANALTVKFGLQLPDNGVNPSIVPFTFGGGTPSITIPAGACAKSDIVNVFLPKGTLVNFRTHVSVASGGMTWLLGPISQDSVSGKGPSNTDRAWSGSFTPTNPIIGYGPNMMTGEVAESVKCWGFCGDSEIMGTGSELIDGIYGNPFVAIACGPNRGATTPHVNLGKGAHSAEDFDRGQSSYGMRALLEGCTHAVVAHGIIDLNAGATLANIKLWLLSIYASMRAAGIRPWGCTVVPYTTGTWSASGGVGQTVKSLEADRLALNAWIPQQVTAGFIDGYFDLAAAVTETGTTGFWKANYTADGLHPQGQTVHAAIAAAAFARLPNL